MCAQSSNDDLDMLVEAIIDGITENMRIKALRSEYQKAVVEKHAALDALATSQREAWATTTSLRQVSTNFPQ